MKRRSAPSVHLETPLSPPEVELRLERIGRIVGIRPFDADNPQGARRLELRVPKSLWLRITGSPPNTLTLHLNVAPMPDGGSVVEVMRIQGFRWLSRRWALPVMSVLWMTGVVVVSVLALPVGIGLAGLGLKLLLDASTNADGSATHSPDIWAELALMETLD